MHVGVLCIVDASELLYCAQRAWRQLTTPLHEVCLAYGVPWVRRQTHNFTDDVRLALRSIEELPCNGSVSVIPQ